MKPFEHARNIIRLDAIDRTFVVSLASDAWRLVLAHTPSAQQADHVAFIGRMIVASEIVRALRHEDCRLAALVDVAYLAGKINFPSQVSTLCRDQAELHHLDCMPECQSELIQTTEKL